MATKKPDKPEPERFGTSEELIARMARANDTCLVSFSRGKDACATYLAVRPHFKRVIPYYYEVVPGLEFVNESIAYFEKKMGTHIIRMPSAGFYRQLRNFVYQPPDRVRLIESMDLPDLTQDDIQRFVCEDAGVDYETTYNTVGMRAKDSMMRALYFQKQGPINHTRKMFFPIFDWDKQRVIDTIRNAGWKLPIDYKLWTSSFDGLYLNYLYQVKKHFPRDYQRILLFFPLAELEVLRYEASLHE